MNRFEHFLREIPKSELHVHLRGAMPAQFFGELFSKYRPEHALRYAPPRHRERFESCDNIRPFLSSESGLADQPEQLYRYITFEQFLTTYLFTSYFFREIADLEGLVKTVKAHLVSQNIVYAEITVSIQEYVNQGLPLRDVLAVLDRAAEGPGLRVQWIVDLVRNFGPEAGTALLREILELRPRSIVGITLGGSEQLFPPAPFADCYRLARDHGLRLTVHAGEAMGPESVWDAVRLLEVERIGHGVRAIEDQQLVAHLAETQLPLEICPTSNVRTGISSSYESHPIRSLFQAGIPVTINTDDPTFFDVTLVDELQRLLALGFSEDDVVTIIKNGFQYAFLPESETERYRQRVEQSWQAFRDEK